MLKGREQFHNVPLPSLNTRAYFTCTKVSETIYRPPIPIIELLIICTKSQDLLDSVSKSNLGISLGTATYKDEKFFWFSEFNSVFCASVISTFGVRLNIRRRHISTNAQRSFRTKDEDAVIPSQPCLARPRFRLDRRPQLALEELPSRISGQSSQEEHTPSQFLVLGQSLLAVSQNILFRQSSTGASHDVGSRLFDVWLRAALDANDGRVRNPRVCEQNALDLGGRDLEPADFDELLSSVHHIPFPPLGRAVHDISSLVVTLGVKGVSGGTEVVEIP